MEENPLQEKAHQINPEKARWLENLGIAMPLCLSYLPIGIACGILLHAAGMNFLLTLLVSIVVFSGGAQFILASLLVIDAPISTIFITLFFLELRYALLGSSLSKYLSNESPAMIFLFSFSMNDENYAVNYLKFVTDKHWTTRDALMVEHYSLISWAGGNMIGGLIGNTISIDLNIVDFALTALFLYMIVMQIQRRLSLFICILSVFVSLFCLLITRSTIGIIVSTLLMSLLGFWIEFEVRKHHANPDDAWILGKLFRPRTTRTTKEDVEVEKQLEEEAEEADENTDKADDVDDNKDERGDRS
ncbi:MAG TPA: AzlC family ABC transporter permease [Candidatus Limosilactobacillus merdigallinarum]|uniref:AzlC family ABC transporter permease n=1 Tax=Candidatus Limosilactobacillus merdigallinarum TaxID=2838652 RepID=A0A9D2AKC2_9LACO|nr:AzlC family ABC transporter permease [Candidatus Limosilactobacillus merdigallinarum]